jgi:DNA excision repair protein ERCC-6-like 2
MKNLFSFQSENVVLKEIVNKTNVAESRAGVDVVGFDPEATQKEDDEFFSKDADSEDSAISQLAALVMGEEKKSQKLPKNTKIDAIKGILSGAGVEYTHDNAEVVGSSKIEERLSRRAEEAGDDVVTANERVFISQHDQPQALENHAKLHLTLTEASSSSYPTYIYDPPISVGNRHFCEMARHFGIDDTTEFALMIEGLGPSERTNLLDEFYRSRREMLALKGVLID